MARAATTNANSAEAYHGSAAAHAGKVLESVWGRSLSAAALVAAPTTLHAGTHGGGVFGGIEGGSSWSAVTTGR